jgi:hypothetical protein
MLSSLSVFSIACLQRFYNRTSLAERNLSFDNPFVARYLVMECCAGGELQEVLGELPGVPTPAPFPELVPRFPEPEAKRLAKDVLSAIS